MCVYVCVRARARVQVLCHHFNASLQSELNEVYTDVLHSFYIVLYYR